MPKQKIDYQELKHPSERSGKYHSFSSDYLEQLLKTDEIDINTKIVPAGGGETNLFNYCASHSDFSKILPTLFNKFPNKIPQEDIVNAISHSSQISVILFYYPNFLKM